MIVSITQHDGENLVFVTPQNTRSLIVKRRYKYLRYEWGGWHSHYLGENFPEGYELRVDMLKTGTWSSLKPVTVGIPFESYIYLNNADGARFQVDGGGMLLGALLSGMHHHGGRLLEHVYLVVSEAGHYYHAPDTKRRPGEVPRPERQETPPVQPVLTGRMLHRLIDTSIERLEAVFLDPLFREH